MTVAQKALLARFYAQQSRRVSPTHASAYTQVYVGTYMSSYELSIGSYRYGGVVRTYVPDAGRRDGRYGPLSVIWLLTECVSRTIEEDNTSLVIIP